MFHRWLTERRHARRRSSDVPRGRPAPLFILSAPFIYDVWKPTDHPAEIQISSSGFLSLMVTWGSVRKSVEIDRFLDWKKIIDDSRQRSFVLSYSKGDVSNAALLLLLLFLFPSFFLIICAHFVLSAVPSNITSVLYHHYPSYRPCYCYYCFYCCF